MVEKTGGDLASAMKGFAWAGVAAQQREAAERCGARLVTLEDGDYPAGLRAISDPPPFLLVRGTVLREDALAVAVVGSRRPTSYGLGVAGRLAGDLGARGITVVSGLARGVDTAAHRGAMATGGRTIGVLGCGVDVVYPPENRGLVGDVAKSGALLSQFPMGTSPLAQHFPIRNRTIAALSLGAIVVEAAGRSGALITARVAAELGREVYAVPGNVSSAASEGTNRLIQDGAKLVRGWEDVVAEWPPAWQGALRPPRVLDRPGAPSEPLASGDERILTLLGDAPVTVDALVHDTRMPAGEVAARLVRLELHGLVSQLPGQRYVKT